MLGGISLGYYEMIANCVDYAEYLAWFRENRKKKKKSERLQLSILRKIR
jgi:hypothetical protein